MNKTVQVDMTHEEVSVLSSSLMLLFRILPEVKQKIGSKEAATLIGLLQRMKNQVEAA